MALLLSRLLLPGRKSHILTLLLHEAIQDFSRFLNPTRSRILRFYGVESVRCTTDKSQCIVGQEFTGLDNIRLSWFRSDHLI